MGTTRNSARRSIRSTSGIVIPAKAGSETRHSRESGFRDSSFPRERIQRLVIPAKADSETRHSRESGFRDSSFPRKRESMLSISGCDESSKSVGSRWIPAFAGMTTGRRIPAFAGMTTGRRIPAFAGMTTGRRIPAFAGMTTGRWQMDSRFRGNDDQAARTLCDVSLARELAQESVHLLGIRAAFRLLHHRADENPGQFLLSGAESCGLIR